MAREAVSEDARETGGRHVEAAPGGEAALETGGCRGARDYGSSLWGDDDSWVDSYAWIYHWSWWGG